LTLHPNKQTNKKKKKKISTLGIRVTLFAYLTTRPMGKTRPIVVETKRHLAVMNVDESVPSL